MATLNSLEVADKHDLITMAFPAISTGIFGYPMDRCARVMLSTVIEYVLKNTKIKTIVFCLWGEDSYQVFKETLTSLIKELP